MDKHFLFVLFICFGTAVTAGAEPSSVSSGSVGWRDVDYSVGVDRLSALPSDEESSELEQEIAADLAEDEPMELPEPSNSDTPPVSTKPKKQSVDVSLDENGTIKIDDRPVDIKTGSADSSAADFDMDDMEAIDEDVAAEMAVDPQSDLQDSPLREYDMESDLQNTPLQEFNIKNELQDSPLKKYELKHSGKQATTAVEKTRDFKKYPKEGIAPKFKDKDKEWAVPSQEKSERDAEKNWPAPIKDQSEHDPRNDLQNSPLREFDINKGLQNSPLRKYDKTFNSEKSLGMVKSMDRSFDMPKDIDGTFDSDVNNDVARRGFRPEDTKAIEMHLTILPGYRMDNIDWNIAGNINGTSPNILSELQWQDLEIRQLKAKGDFIFQDHWVLDYSGAYGQIFEGKNQDSDYDGNNRTLEFSRSNNDASGGDVLDYSGGLGYRMYLGRHMGNLDMEHLWVTFLGGYSRHEQNLEMTDGFQTIPATGAFAGLNSTYETEWKGPWAGLELAGQRGKFKGSLRFEYHHVDYYAVADWNLRSDFQHPKSYEHMADGQGFVGQLLMAYAVTKHFDINLGIDFQDWQAEDGIDRTFFSSGSVIDTRLNEVNWESQAYMVGGTYHFDIPGQSRREDLYDDEI